MKPKHHNDITFCSNSKCNYKHLCGSYIENYKGYKPYVSIADLEDTNYCLKKAYSKMKTPMDKYIINNFDEEKTLKIIKVIEHGSLLQEAKLGNILFFIRTRLYLSGGSMYVMLLLNNKVLAFEELR